MRGTDTVVVPEQEPPHTVGEKYTMPNGTQVDWNWDTVAQLAKILTVDSKGNDATKSSFDAKNISQFGAFAFDYANIQGSPNGVVSAVSLPPACPQASLLASQSTSAPLRVRAADR